MYKVRSFGRDCYGNISGYLVERFHGNQKEQAGIFVGNIYRDGSFAEALKSANQLCDKLNRQMECVNG
jgi:hypothetical protein